ncbi:hypothetical protein PaeBR_17645 [Paenibacillus sp. BR2-3]
MPKSGSGRMGLRIYTASGKKAEVTKGNIGTGGAIATARKLSAGKLATKE